ncbi:dolichyl-phosphate-mannose--protein mannosyltransferase [Thermococcus sp. MV5]|uniref:dolichyl-phosphate-mannose--protein mannosyltransferase n=1 Tax=Thermococcus sp. MV5 TaxID=1638272 RepID=UPI001F0DCFEB|nr:dolichyl-phosphate-mannose--protein mannosyltransferase [Thermococcus sp. MV5]
MKMRELKKRLYFALVALIILGTFWYSYEKASSSELYDYIGDEVWYIPAARNVLHKLGFELHYLNETTNSEGINIISKGTIIKGYVNVSAFGFEFTRPYTRNVAFQTPPLLSKIGIKLEFTPLNKTQTSNFDEIKFKIEVIAKRYNYTYYKPYSNFPGVYYEIPQENIDEFIDEVKKIEGIEIVKGFRYPDKENIQNYLNTEHPFLGKDIIMLGMLIEDKPIFWRLPGLIEHAIINLIVFLVTYKIVKSYLAAFIALIFSAFDPLLYATSLTAMLDIHVAFFTAVFMYFLILDRYSLSGTSIGLAASTKLNGVFSYPVLVIKTLKERTEPKKCLVSLIFLPAIAFLLPQLPIIMAIGFFPWLSEFIGSFGWHLSYKGDHPANSPFWEWFISLKPFAFHYNPDIFAATDPILMLSMIVFIFAIPYAAMKRRKLLIPFGIFWSTIAFYALQWILGGKTQFSFYATPLVPPGAVTLGVMAYEIIKWEYFKNSIQMYWRWAKGILLWVWEKIQKFKVFLRNLK